MSSQVMTQIDWNKVLDSIPQDATEAEVSDRFVKILIKALGFNDKEYYLEFPTGTNADKVDFGVRRDLGNKDSLKLSKNPDLLIEVKGRAIESGVVINLGEGTPKYQAAKKQIKKYLLAPNCKTAKWGIITNSTHIQLFRKHGKVIFPATPNILIKKSTFSTEFERIKQLIQNPVKALTVCLYNNKGELAKQQQQLI